MVGYRSESFLVKMLDADEIMSIVEGRFFEKVRGEKLLVALRIGAV